MAHRSFQQIGQKVAFGGWGIDDGGDLDQAIKDLSPHNQTTSLLVALINEVSNLDKKNEIAVKNAIASDRDTQKRLGAGDRLTPTTNDELKEEGLSVRAIRAIRLSDVQFVSDLDEKRLELVRGCGKKTIDEILAWASKYKTID